MADRQARIILETRNQSHGSRHLASGGLRYQEVPDGCWTSLESVVVYLCHVRESVVYRYTWRKQTISSFLSEPRGMTWGRTHYRWLRAERCGQSYQGTYASVCGRFALVISTCAAGRSWKVPESVFQHFELIAKTVNWLPIFIYTNLMWLNWAFIIFGCDNCCKSTKKPHWNNVIRYTILQWHFNSCRDSNSF